MRDITDAEFNKIRDYIKTSYGINLGNEKKSLIYSRLRSTLHELQIDNFTDYFDYLLKDKSGDAVIHFINKITTNHTFFMRETDHFDYLKKNVLPYIEEKHAKAPDFRLWCAGCSSGEEAYTLEMIARDFFGGKPQNWNTEILATDISSNVLDKAIQGVYSNESISTLPQEWRKKYFKKHDDNSGIVIDEIKKLVTYRKFNLMDERFPFKKPFQVIFCRNVMIYFDNQTRDNLIKKFYDLTEPGGYLFIGHSESLNHTSTEYKYIMPAVYRKQQ